MAWAAGAGRLVATVCRGAVVTLVFVLVALIAGALLPVQAGINNQLRAAVGSPIIAGFISATLSASLLCICTLALRLPFPTTTDVGSAPLHAWLGGFIGAFVLLATIVLAPRLGAGVLVALIVAGQVGASLLLDQFGLLGFPLQQATPLRVLGAGLLVAGVVLVRLF